VSLFLDFDGTLAPIQKWPQEAQMSRLTKSLLNQISHLKGVHVGIISGRARNDLYGRVGIPNIYYASCHGLEIEGPGVSYRHPEVGRVRPLLAQIVKELRRRTRKTPGTMIEDKGLSVSLHYRNAKREMVPLLHELFREVLEIYTEQIETISGKEVLEVRPKVHWNKGNAVFFLMEHLRKKEGKVPFCIYIGDDVTDENAFAAIRGKGISIRVGSEQPTSADYFLQNIRGVQRLLNRMIGLFRN